jgi:excinuclease ABC subunit C
MNTKLQNKLKELPTTPGIYFHKNSKDEIIYIGKAANLRNRVRQYFQSSRKKDPKTQLLVSEITDTDWMSVDSEVEALFLEAEMVRRYMPRYNILLRDDKSMVYIRIDYDSDYPTVSFTRRPLDDSARYFGPFSNAQTTKQAMKILRRAFPYATARHVGKQRVSLDYHLGLDPGLEEAKTSLKEYRSNLRQLIAVIEGKRKGIQDKLEKDMLKFAKATEFEQAAKVRNQLNVLRNLHNQIVFSDKEFMDISKDHALDELVRLLGLGSFPQRIEGYDISHMSGTDVVASMVVFTNGVSDKSEYRKFKTYKDQNNDFDNMYETIKRRLSIKNIKLWGAPNLVIIDGGKGQLGAAIKARDEMGCSGIPFISLAKREEQIVVSKLKSNVAIIQDTLHSLGGFLHESDDYVLINIPHNTNLVKLLQRIRDESHRFAVSYHSVLKTKRQTTSLLGEIPGVGQLTRKKLIKSFGSKRAVGEVSEQELAAVVGASRAKKIYNYLHEPGSPIKS